MKRTLLVIFLSVFLLQSQAQLETAQKKYPSLLWEISGNGLKKPSYLIGTMHVSSKLAFNLPDSFYIAVRSAQVVALETNPETWQEDMSKYDFGSSGYGNYAYMPGDYIRQSTLKFYKYDSKIERSLYSNPSTINNLLYRSYGNESSDFEEDTYLDMYIYQCGKKWGKKVAGVEDYGKSMKLMAEAYRDAAKDEDKKERSYGDGDDEYSADKLQEAYRSGNLDLLDSINRYNSFSEAFDEKFLYRRNEIQASSIDSIIRSGSSLFVGVGAAHLPGKRGVIELLRKEGYRLRPIIMGERASKQKEMVDKIRVPVSFHTTTAADGLYTVAIPGTFYKFGEDPALDQQQYADMANGSYYMVTRIMTNAWMWGNTTEAVYKKIDSLLYENIPGKIISKKPITRNGYKGLDITNKTRRGDVQRYNIFITPFEIIFFKMSGTGDYVTEGDEARQFFESIVLKEYKTNPVWKKFSAPGGGFSIKMPHQPFIGNDGSWIFDAEDKAANTQYRVVKTDIHNYHFAEADSFDLRLMEESFAASDFIGDQLSRVPGNHKGYPSLDCKYNSKFGGIYLVKFIIQGPHYYTLIAHGPQETPEMKEFFSSFEITPFTYAAAMLQTDTALYYAVQSSIYPDTKKIKIDIPRNNFSNTGDEEEETEADILDDGVFRSKIVKNDTTGEKIYISFYRSPRYYYSSDSSMIDKEAQQSYLGDSSWIIRSRVKSTWPDSMKVWETLLSDTASSRQIWIKTYYKNGSGFSLTSETDTLSKPSLFVKTFYESFLPADTLKAINPFIKKSAIFFQDLFSEDSSLSKKAVKYIPEIELDKHDLPQLIRAVKWLSWDKKDYLDIKKSLIRKFGEIKTPESASFLKQLYFALDDTVQLQYPVLENLLQQKTTDAYQAFKEIVNTDPPVLGLGTKSYSYANSDVLKYYKPGYSYDDGKFMDELFDSLKLTKKILPDLLPLLNLDDYKKDIMQLLGDMVDSNIIKQQDYDMYFSKFLVEAKQELKKQSIKEKRKEIEKAEERKSTNSPGNSSGTDDERDYGNEELSLYATLLLPFEDRQPAVAPLIQRMLNSSDKRLKYNTLMLLLRNKKPYADTLLKYFASLDEYRYQLYKDLLKMGKPDKFPALYNNHLDLGRSKLLSIKSYDKPDSIVYVDRLSCDYLGKTGFIYFFKYKMKKDDLNWKLSMVGLVPENPKEFEFSDNAGKRKFNSAYSYGMNRFDRYDITDFDDTKLADDTTVDSQLKLAVKKLIFASQKSGKMFFEENNRRSSDDSYYD